MNEEYITKSAAIEAVCDTVELFPSEYQEIENAINRVADDVALVMDTTELEDLKAKYQALVAEKAKTTETLLKRIQRGIAMATETGRLNCSNRFWTFAIVSVRRRMSYE